MNRNFYINSYAVWTKNVDGLLPDVSFIPVLIRRRLTDIEKIGLYLANQVCGDRTDYYVVFASRFGEWGQTVKLIKQFYEDREMSPAGFSNSVHNAMSGILSVLKHNTNAYTAIAGNEETIDNALVEVFCGKKPVLFIYAEEKMPDLYIDVCKDENISSGFGCAFLISNEPGGVNVGVTLAENGKNVSFDDLIEFLKNDDKKVLETAFLNIKKV